MLIKIENNRELLTNSLKKGTLKADMIYNIIIRK